MTHLNNKIVDSMWPCTRKPSLSQKLNMYCPTHLSRQASHWRGHSNCRTWDNGHCYRTQDIVDKAKSPNSQVCFHCQYHWPLLISFYFKMSKTSQGNSKWHITNIIIVIIIIIKSSPQLSSVYIIIIISLAIIICDHVQETLLKSEIF